jgi:SAM-dependent methyltransferase
MVEHAKKTYGYPKLEFKVLDIENVNECISYTNSFDKIFSFFCFHWIHKKADALINMKTMLKSGGEILLHFMLVNPIVELYKYIDAEWQIFVKVSILFYLYVELFSNLSNLIYCNIFQFTYNIKYKYISFSIFHIIFLTTRKYIFKCIYFFHLCYLCYLYK